MRLLARASARHRAALPGVSGGSKESASGRGRRSLLENVTGPAGVDLRARADGGGHGDRADVAALGDGGLGPHELLDDRRVVLEQRAVLERGLADDEMHDRRAVGAVLDLAGLGLLHGLGHVHRHRADLRVGHLALRAEDATQATDDGHEVGRRDGDVEVGEAALDALGEVLRADHVGAGLLGLARLVALGEDGDGHVLAQAVGQRDGSAQLLVGVAHVQPGADVDLDGLVELRRRGPLDERDRLGGRVLVLAVDPAARLEELLAVLGHQATSTPIERAVPAMILIAASTSLALRSGSFFSAIARSWSCVIRPTFSRCGSPEPFSMLIAWRISTAAGGVLVTKVNERSSKTVISTGIVVPMSFAVWALNALTNSMMLMPCWPRAGPTGGAGEAWPPGACSLMVVRTFLAIRSSSPGRTRPPPASRARRWRPGP